MIFSNNVNKSIIVFLLLFGDQLFAKRVMKSDHHKYSVEFIKSLPEPYSNLNRLLPFNNHGWYGNAKWVQRLMTHNKIRICIEIGSWFGLSTRHIASLLQQGGQLYAVDTWQGSEEHWNDKNFEGMLSVLYEQFLSNMIHANFTNVVIPLKIPSVQAAPILSEKLKQVDMVYIDALHDTVSVLEDLKSYWPFVENNKGILCGDDWAWDSVKLAVQQFAALHNLAIYYGDNFWFVKEENQYMEKCFKNITSIDIWIFQNLQ